MAETGSQHGHRYSGNIASGQARVHNGDIYIYGESLPSRLRHAAYEWYLLLTGESVDVFEWLSPTLYDKRHNEIKHSRIEGTGRWLLETAQYRCWRFELDAPSFLWCHGGPGAGKTVLTYSRVLFIITAVSTTDLIQVLSSR